MTDRSSPPDLKSWAFWRRRLGRALIVGGLALAAVEFLPKMPKEQNLIFEPDATEELQSLSLTYGKQGDPVDLGGTTITPASPVPRLPFSFRLPNGTYRLRVDATVLADDSKISLRRVETRVVLDGSTARVKLPSR